MNAVRLIAAVGGVGLLAVGVTGCNTRAFSEMKERELVVVFSSDATHAQHLAARTACTGAAAHTTPEALPTSHRAVDRLYDIRYRVDDASAADLAKLQTCLQHQPGVVGFNIPDNSLS